MTLESWLHAAIADAEARGLGELKTLLEGLAQSTRALRCADFNDDLAGARPRRPAPTPSRTDGSAGASSQ